MEKEKFYELYWNYYLQLEKDFFDLEPFCTIDKGNDSAFSIKYLQLILSICGEIDTICKRLCSCLNHDMDINTAGINDYKDILMEHYPKISEEKVTINQHVYREVQPFQTWAHKHTPQWWSIYNKVKHHRDELWNNKEAYKYANQKTVIEALSGLYIILQYWAAYNYVLSKHDRHSNEMQQIQSKHFSIKEWIQFYSFFMGNYFFEADSCRAYFGVVQEEEVDVV